MNDPHVESLQYRLSTVENFTYEAPALSEDTETFSIQLDQDVLLINLKKHFQSEHAARLEVEHYLRAWEIKASLENEYGQIKFKFKKSCIIDRDPPPPPGPNNTLTAVISSLGAVATADIVMHRTLHEYPKPPVAFEASENVQTLYLIYNEYKQRRNRLTSMSFLAYTLITKIEFNSQADAAKRLKVDLAVLKTLSRVSTIRGDMKEVRKFDRENKDLKPLEDSEKHWMDMVVKSLIVRLAEYEYWTKLGVDVDDKLKQITEDDFPALPPCSTK